MINYKEIGKRIKKLRNGKGLSQLQIQLRLQEQCERTINASTISRIENGNSITLNLLDEIAKFFGVSLYYLLSDDSSINSENLNDPVISELIQLLKNEPRYFKKKVLEITKILRNE